MIRAKFPELPCRRYTLYPVTFAELSTFQVSVTVWAGAAVPVPLSVAVEGESEALLVNDTVVEDAPLACGANVTVKSTLCPAARITGKDKPLIENSELPTSTAVTVTLAPVAASVPV